MKKIVMVINMLLCVLFIQSQSIKGFTLGDNLSNTDIPGVDVLYDGCLKVKEITLGGVEGFVICHILNDGRIYELEFRTDSTKDYDINVQFGTFRDAYKQSLQDHYNIDLSWPGDYDFKDPIYQWMTSGYTKKDNIIYNFLIKSKDGKPNISFSITDINLKEINDFEKTSQYDDRVQKMKSEISNNF